MPTLSFCLAEWAAGFSLQDAPTEVLQATRLHALDLIGVMLGSQTHRVVLAATAAQQDADGGGHGAAPLWSRAETSPSGAAFINGVASAVLEFDDTHIASNIHPTGVILAALLAEAQRRPTSGRQLLEALITGSEILCRLGLVSPVRMHEVGFHPTSVYGVFAASYAIARMRGLSPELMAHAVGIAASLSSGSISAFQDGADSKTLHVGFAASAAMRAVALAEQGLTGPAAVFEGKFGWFRSHVQSDVTFRFEALTRELGQHWDLLDIAPKFYPCAYTLMPFIAAALALRRRKEFALEAIAEIRCAIMGRSFATVCEPVADKRRPRTSWHGRISLQHTVAEALALGRFGKSAYDETSLRDPRINALADKVVHLRDPAADADTTRSRAVVTLLLEDGTMIEEAIEDMVGTRRNPAPDSLYREKFRANVADVLSPEEAERLADTLMEIEAIADIDAFLSGLRR
ncbi:MAG: MmgE/PrpD family protein [Devosia sp.]